MEAVEVRRSSRARRWRLEVPWGKPARLTVPQAMTAHEVGEVIAQQRDWLLAERRQQRPRLGLERLAVSESEGRIAARELISALAEEEAPRIGVSYSRLRIGDQHTRWGSCSARGTISFNWRLVLAPFDHSQRFWRLLERHRPHWRERRDWLRKHGPELLGYDAAA